MKNFDGCDGAAIAELLATDEVLCPVLLHKSALQDRPTHAQEAVEYVKVLMKLLGTVSDKRAVQYALTVIERCVFGKSARTTLPPRTGEPLACFQQS